MALTSAWPPRVFSSIAQRRVASRSTAAVGASTHRRVEFIALDRLRFDALNPRLPRSLDRDDEGDVVAWMLTDATLLELMGSIAEQGYFPGEPLLVVPDVFGAEDPATDVFTVVEGNRRLAATKLLSTPSLAPTRQRSVRELVENADHRPNELPCLIFDDRKETLDYLGFRHITGIKEWEPLAKARYLRDMYDDRRRRKLGQQAAIKDIALTIGSRTDYVARLLTSLYILEYVIDAEFFEIRGLDEDSIEFSLLSTAVSYRSIAEFMGLKSPSQVEVRAVNHENLQLVIEWMFALDNRRVISESRDIRKLAAVLKNRRAAAALRKTGSLERAVLLTDEPQRVFRKTVTQARDRLLLAQSQVHLVDNLTEEDEEELRGIMQLARDLRATVRTRIDEVDEA